MAAYPLEQLEMAAHYLLWLQLAVNHLVKLLMGVHYLEDEGSCELSSVVVDGCISSGAT